MSDTTGMPVLGGVTLPRPNRRARVPQRLDTDVELAGGGRSRYTRGQRLTFELGWTRMREASALALDELLRGPQRLAPFTFVDVDGRSYVVLVDDYSGLDPIPGTAPARYPVTLTLGERASR